VQIETDPLPGHEIAQIGEENRLCLRGGQEEILAELVSLTDWRNFECIDRKTYLVMGITSAESGGSRSIQEAFTA